jgi:hypothetical protein
LELQLRPGGDLHKLLGCSRSGDGLGQDQVQRMKIYAEILDGFYAT